MKIWVFSLTFAFLALFSSSHAIVYKAWSGQKTNVQGNKYFIHLLCDEHCVHKNSPTQQEHCIQSAKQLGALVLVEDGQTYDQFYTHFKLFLGPIHPTIEFLFDLTRLCKQSYIAAKNIEFRSCKGDSMYRGTVSTQKAIGILDHLIAQAEQYDDGLLLNECYRNIINKLKPFTYLIDALRNYNKPIWELLEYDLDLLDISEQEVIYLLKKADAIEEALDEGAIDKRFHIKNYAKAFELIVTFFDACLLDIRILHELYHNQIKHNNFKHIIVCAGGWHIENVRSILKKLGYTFKKRTRRENVSHGINIAQFFKPFSNAEVSPSRTQWNIHSPQAYFFSGHTTTLAKLNPIDVKYKHLCYFY